MTENIFSITLIVLQLVHISRKISRKLKKKWNRLNQWKKILRVEYTQKMTYILIAGLLKNLLESPLKILNFVFNFFSTLDNLRIRNSAYVI